MKKLLFTTILFSFSFAFSADDKKIQNCAYSLEKIAEQVPITSLAFNYNQLLNRQGNFTTFVGAKIINGLSKEGIYLMEAGDSGQLGSTFIVLDGDGPHMMAVKTPLSMQTINITASKAAAGWAIKEHTPNKYGFFRDEARAYYEMNLDSKTRDLLKKDDEFEKNYLPVKDQVTNIDNEVRATYLDAMIRRFEIAEPACSEILSAQQILELEKKLEVDLKTRKNIKVPPLSSNPVAIADSPHLSKVYGFFGKLDKSYIKDASAAFVLDGAIYKMRNVIQTAKAKRYYKFNENYPMDQMGNFKMSQFPLCDQDKIVGAVNMCTEAIQGMSLSNEKKFELTDRLNKLISLKNKVAVPSGKPEAGRK